MKAGNRKKGAKAAGRKRLCLLLVAILAIQMAVSPVMAGMVTYAMEEAHADSEEAADTVNAVSSGDAESEAFTESTDEESVEAPEEASAVLAENEEAPAVPRAGQKLLYAREAEDAQLLNGARTTDAEKASGGKMVGYIGTDGGNHADGMVTFTMAGVKAGSYELCVYYAVDKSDDRYFDIHVNGQVIETGKKLPGTGSFDTPSEIPHSVVVDLKDGVNTVSFGCEGWYAPNLDCIEIYGAEEVVWDEPGQKQLYRKEAEAAQLSNGATAKEAEKASGGEMVNGIGTDGGGHADGTVTFTIPGVKAGSYELKVYYATDSGDRYFDIQVNGEMTGRTNFPSTESFDIPCETPVSVNIELKEGENTISFGCKDWYAPNLDRIEIWGLEDIFWEEEGPEPPADQKLVYEEEAENAELTNGAGITDAERASGGKMVNYIGTDNGGHEDGTVTFKVSDVAAGNYELWIYYGVDSNDRYFDINVNGEKVKGAAFPSTGDFKVPGKMPAKVKIELEEGENTISFSCAGWYAPNLDRIQIYEAKEADPAADGYYEAEDGALGGKAQVKNSANASGGLKVGDIGGGDGEDKGYVTFTVNVEEAGLYAVGIYYISGDPRPLTISVNGESPVSVTCPSTGSWDDDAVGRAAVDLELAGGENRITIGSNTWGPDLDRIYVPKEKKEADLSVDTRLTLQAEEAVLLGSASKDYNSSSCANGGKVSNIGGDGQGAVLFEGIEIAEAGTYAIDVAYAAKEDRKFLITVDGNSRDAESGKEIWMSCPAGYDWDVPNRHIVTCDLEAGTHSIMISNPEGYAANLDEIRLYRCQVYDMGKYTFLYDLETGRYNMIADGRTRLNDVFAAVSVGGELCRSVEYTSHEVKEETVSDAFGKGTVLHSISRAEGRPVLEQDFYLYEGQDYFLTQLDVFWEDGREMGTNYIAPLYVSSVGGVENEMDGKDYFLRVPYDNDGWVRYELSSLSGSNTGYEAAAVLNEKNGKALIMGSLSHDTWKTGISYTGSQNQLFGLEIYGGASGELTRDQSAHGTVTGREVESPLMFVGYYNDWQDGMDAYAKANTVVVKPKMDAGNVPFGWNSWGSVQTDINLKTANDISDYIHDNLQDAWTTDDSDVVYVNLDSYWDMLSDEELAEFVRHCKANGQEAGIYWAPFVSWHGASSLDTAYVEGTQGTEYENTLYRDIILKKDDGSLYDTLDGAFPVDMTHPAAQLRVDYFIDRFKRAGFTYIKLDFLVHGALEGDHYDKSIAQTGTQAYNFGMQYVTARLDGQMFINLSIAPTFPYQYADGKRIACDAYYSIGNTEYTLNGLTYGFWQKNLYQYPDPDHLVIWGRDGKASLEEARSRVTSGILLGTSFLAGDNFVDPVGDKETADERFRTLLTNPDIIAVAKTGKIFRPVEVSHNRDAANMFVMTDGDVTYLAVLNYDLNKEYERNVDLKELFGAEDTEPVKELWSGEAQTLQDGVLSISLDAKDAKVYRVGTVKAPEVSPEPTKTPEPEETPEPVKTPEPTKTPESEVTPKPTETPGVTVAPNPGDNNGNGDNASGGNTETGTRTDTTSPETGDSANLFVWLLLVIALAAAAGVGSYYRYREKTEESF